VDRSELKKAYERLKAQKKNIAKKAEEGAEALFGIVEVGGTAFAAGYGRATFGENGVWEIAGVDAVMLAGVTIHGLAFFLSDKYSTHAHNVGNGAIGEYLGQKGYMMGLEARQNKGTSGFRQMQGADDRIPQNDYRGQSAFARAA
jgi:hypothetical protein